MTVRLEAVLKYLAAIAQVNWWARRITVGAKHAAVTFEGAKHGIAGLAVIEILAGIGRHFFLLHMTAFGAS
jgi:hypothetical protein